ncbi:permease prefix domain 1-containing protein [Jiangella alkaliphila]|uniref:Uncharacterized protein n=1 Tax=Jiangella alkaliphila TaxID=419479 RepID=A0A1H2GZA3_9ACTN|nr:permease prefix domain 1-containing protein [Jiangella alkaliphila]SDU24896.1 hypothetical protein SAMN04488563_0756 [Jiangella alkaliphila]
MAGHEQLIDTYLAELARRLPPGIVNELADGLDETLQHHLARGLSPDEAATAATAEFGDPARITAEFARQSPGHRTALAMLASGPIFAALWGTTLITSHAWTWTIPTAATIVYAAILLAIVTLLVTVATSQNYLTTRLAAPACAGMIVLDVTMITLVAVIAPSLTWSAALAATASISRITLGAHQVRRILCN